MKHKKLIISKDLLWKALIKDLFEDFIHFFYPKEVAKIDFKKGYDFLDKELEKLYPENEPKNRRADLLVKVHLKKGGTAWLLIHIEVQGYVDKNFAKRMFEMNYRAYERLGKEVIGFAIFTDDDPNFHPKGFGYGRWGSEMIYKFKTYKLLENDPKDYAGKKTNPFAAIMKTAWYGLKKNQLKTDEELLTLKFQLLRELLLMGHNRTKITKVIEFIKFYSYFDKKDYYHKFENGFDLLTKTPLPMTIEEVVKSEIIRFEKEEAFEKGIEQTKEKAAVNMLKRGYSVEIIADLLELTMEQVLAIKEKFKL